MTIVTRKHRKRPGKLLKRIRAAVQAGKRKKANWLVVEWLRSLEAKRLSIRLAYRKMRDYQRPKKSELDAIAEHLDPWKGSDEVAYVAKRAKEHKPDDYRLTIDFGIENRALQYLVLLVLRELVELHPSQYQTNPYGPRGTHPAIRQVKKALTEGYVWAIEYDIKDCYPSFNGKELWKFLPLPKKVIETVLLCEHLNLKGGYSKSHSSGSVGCEKDDEAGANLLNDHLVNARRGISQGSAASPFVAEAVLSSTLHQIPNIGVIVAYADNILLLAKTKGDVVSMSKCLGSALEAHPVGPLYSKVKCFDPGQSIEFLGHKFTAKNGVVHIEPDNDNLEKFTFRVASELDYLNKTPLPNATRKKRLKRLEVDIGSWAGAFKLCDNVAALTAQWLTKAKAQGNEALESVSKEKKPVTNTVKKAFKLHLEYVCQGYMGTSPSGSQNAKAALTAEFKKSGDEFLFLERVGNWLDEILGKEVTVKVSE